MKELDKEKMGLFIAQLRREKEATQKELADRLYVSDKAVSKWERGLSVPDISLLLPLAEILGVTTTELLRGERFTKPQLEVEQVEELVAGAIHLTQGRKEAASFMERDMDFVCHCRSGAGWIFVGVCDSCGGIGDLCVVGRGVNFGVQRIFLLFCQGTSA